MQVLAGVLVGSVGFVTIMSFIPSFIRDLDNRVRSIYYEEIVSPYYKWIQSKDKDIKGDRFPEDSVAKRETRKSVVIINTGSTAYCGQAGVARTRDYLNNLLKDGWSIESSEASTFLSGGEYYGVYRGNPCSFSYYILKK